MERLPRQSKARAVVGRQPDAGGTHRRLPWWRAWKRSSRNRGRRCRGPPWRRWRQGWRGRQGRLLLVWAGPAWWAAAAATAACPRHGSGGGGDGGGGGDDGGGDGGGSCGRCRQLCSCVKKFRRTLNRTRLQKPSTYTAKRLRVPRRRATRGVAPSTTTDLNRITQPHFCCGCYPCLKLPISPSYITITSSTVLFVIRTCFACSFAVSEVCQLPVGLRICGFLSARAFCALRPDCITLAFASAS